MATFNNGESLSSVRTKINDAIDKVDGNASFSNDISVSGNITVTGTVDGVDIATRDGVLTTTTTTANAALPVSGGTMTGDVGHGDNVKATFGASNDLEIYHDGSHSYINDAGTGELRIQANGALDINKYTGENMARFFADGAVLLYFDNSKKLETTSSGIDVTGTVVADGLNVTDASSSLLSLMEGASSGADVEYKGATNELVISTGTSGSGSQTPRLAIQRDSGDISFYDSAGVNTRFFWDASAESLGIGTGTGTPLGVMHLKDADSQFIFTRNGTETELKLIGGTNEDSALYFGDAADNVRVGFRHDSSANALRFMGYNNSEAMRIDSSGNVGIGNTNPTTDLHISHSANNTSTLTPSVVENLGLRVRGESASNTTGDIYSGISLGEGYAGIYGYDGGASAATGLGVFTGTNADVDKRITVDANGDISFYEDTGTTAKLTWSAADEELQLASGVALELNGWTITESGGSLYFATGGTNKMKLDASGNLDVVGSVNSNATIT